MSSKTTLLPTGSSSTREETPTVRVEWSGEIMSWKILFTKL